jgi:hypothetical protein
MRDVYAWSCSQPEMQQGLGWRLLDPIEEDGETVGGYAHDSDDSDDSDDSEDSAGMTRESKKPHALEWSLLCVQTPL